MFCEKSLYFYLFIAIYCVFISPTYGLYKPSDDVIVLTIDNYDKKVLGSPSAWIVEFYNSWCGHCKRFAPTWRAVATDVKEWRSVISVGAVDCANKNNTKLCQRYDIKAVPICQIFKPYSSIEDKGEMLDDQKKEKLIARMVDFVSNSTSFDPPRSWPKLQPIVDMHEIWDEVKDHHHQVAFVFEEPWSYVGRQVILDTFLYKRLLVRRMLKEHVTKFGITTFPSLYLINRDASFTRLAKENNTREGMVGALLEMLTPVQLEEKLEIQDGNQVEMNINKPEAAKREPAKHKQEFKPGVYMQDLESTLQYSLRQEVAIHRDLSGDKLIALKQFVTMLAKYFPGRAVVVNYLEIVKTWLSEASTELAGDTWLNAVDDLQEMDAYLPDRIKWMACEGSEPHFRGYPCGMWTLFHTLTVSAYQTQRQNPRDLPIDVLTAIKGYMTHFFGCKTCVDHFLKMAARITPNDLHPRNAIMWLWRAHNQANNRLRGDKTEDPHHPKIQFPPKSLCPKCWSDENVNEDEVIEFLVEFYSKDAIVSIEERDKDSGQSLMPTDKDSKSLDWWERQQRSKDLAKIRQLRSKKVKRYQEKKDQRKNALIVRDKQIDFREEVERFHGPLRTGVQGWGFSNVDMGMCVLFYLLCTVMILLLYYHFIVRKKYRPCKFI